MKYIVGGLGIQGKKRIQASKKFFVGAFDPFNDEANFNSIKEIPLSSYELVKVCTPDNIKKEIINYCIENEKHVLVEKPLSLDLEFLKKIKSKCNKSIIYTAYNHRFEPNILRLKKFLEKNRLGDIYSIDLYYGNGTAKLNKSSKWKDSFNGVTSDLIPHLLDMIDFWFNIRPTKILYKKNLCLENKTYDYSKVIMQYKKSIINLNVSLCSWRNTFKADIIFKKGSLHIDNLVKWGESTFTIRERILPSGYPREKKFKTSLKDPTWKAEILNLKKNISSKIQNDFSKDIWIANVVNNINEKN
jgi:predicted dehydrogenase